ncbi:MAG TPA: Rrf2 family transcriptional regulator [Methylomirabilota bacterium]|nr:Rrf2 family transcriptional regulator [Methylomirabilota bacterium]
MKFSQESFYGLDVMTALAQHESSRPVPIEEIARSRCLPQNFLAKILQKLVRGGLVVSSRGHQRGYALALSSDQITVKEILEVTEGADRFRRCLFWPRRCSEGSPCHLHEIGMATRAELEERLRRLTLADLAVKIGEKS